MEGQRGVNDDGSIHMINTKDQKKNKKDREDEALETGQGGEKKKKKSVGGERGVAVVKKSRIAKARR